MNGRFWRSFTDPMSCNLAVPQALRELAAVTGPIERRTPAGDLQVSWLADIDATDERGYPILGNPSFGGRARGLVPGGVYAPILELHVVPDPTPTPQRSLRHMTDVAKSVARAFVRSWMTPRLIEDRQDHSITSQHDDPTRADA